ncbi:MAG: 4Fe-4S binding protein [Gemmataceae bacterium]|nr:4Fe-4S binding protein [Gemmataceae bacterium]
MRRELPVLDRRLCIQCGDCVAICPVLCLAVLNPDHSETTLRKNLSEIAPKLDHSETTPKKFLTETARGYPYLKRPLECISCQACVLICPTKAIQMK